MKTETTKPLRVTINLSRTVAELLAILDDAGGGETQPLELRVMRVLYQLVDHAQQGVYRKGSWERPWVAQAFGDWMIRERTEPGDPYGRDDEQSRRVFCRPRAGYFDGVYETLDDAFRACEPDDE